MDTYRCIVTKRELRTFTDRPVPEEILRQILNAGRMSGSSKNTQPWHFVVVRDRRRLRELSGFGRFAQHVASAAAAVCVVIDSPRALFDAGRCTKKMMPAGWKPAVPPSPASMHRAEDARAFLGAPDGHVVA